MYHNSGAKLSYCILTRYNLLLLKRNVKGDVSDRVGYDFEQLVNIAKVQVRQEIIYWRTCVS
jgi:hypothetical protein